MATITVSDNTTGSTVGGIEDNELTGFNTTQQLGTAVQAYIDAWQAPDVFVTFVMRIPIPSGSGTVSNAKLRLYMTEKGGVKTALSLYEILRTDWSESQSTYNIYKTSNNWTSGGAQGVGTDRSSSAIATCNVSGTSVNNYIEFTGSGLTSLIQNAVTNGLTSINVIAQFTDLSFTSQNYVRWRTSEGTDGQRPQLVYDLTSSGQTLTPSLFTNTNTFYNATVSTTYALTPSLYTNTNTFYSANVTYSNTLNPVLYTNTQTFYAPTVSTTYTLTPDLFTNSQTFYSATVSQGVTIEPGLYTNNQTFYSPSITVGTITLTPSLYTNDNVFYSATVTGGIQPEPATATNSGVSSSFYKRRRIIIEREQEKEEEPEVIVQKVKRLIARKITNKQIAQKVQAQVIEKVQFQSIDLTQAQKLIDDLKQQEILARMRKKQMQDDEEAIQFFL